MHAAPSVEHDQAHDGAGSSTDEPRMCEVRWCDVGGRRLRREWVTRLRRQGVTITPPVMSRAPMASVAEPRFWTRAERAHRRLKWAQRLVRNALPEGSLRYGVILCGIPARLAA